MMLLNEFDSLSADLPALGHALRTRGWRLATAESCTGGLIAALCTSIAGSSDWFDRGFITYSNAAKTEQIGVPAWLIERHGAVSEEVARSMACGALTHSAAQLALAVTGIAGPGGAVPGRPVGTVWLAWAWRLHLDAQPQCAAECLHASGDRTAVRSTTVAQALARARAVLGP